MKCEQIRELIPDWLDGETDEVTDQVIKNHIASCQACREEAELWRAIGTSLRDSAGAVKAPAGFTAQVMAQLPKEQPDRGWGSLIHRWKRGIAAAAAFMMLAAGSAAGYVQWFANPAHTLAGNDRPGQVSKLAPESNDVKAADPSAQQNTGPAKPGVKTSPGDPAGNNSDRPGDQEAGNGKNSPGISTDPGRQDKQPAANAGRDDGKVNIMNAEDYALLNIDHHRYVERTLYKVKVSNLSAARGQAIAYIDGAGAQYEVLGSEGTAAGGQETIKVVVDNAMAGQLTGNLQTLGQTDAPSTQKDDITARYNEKVEQYQALAAQLQSAGSQAEKEQLQVKIAGIKAQLKAWDKEAKTRTIILWLES